MLHHLSSATIQVANLVIYDYHPEDVSKNDPLVSNEHTLLQNAIGKLIDFSQNDCRLKM